MNAPPKLVCPVAKACGGCGQIELSFEAQRSLKLTSAKAALSASLERASREIECSFHPASATEGYRNRIRLRITDDGQLAFFNRDKARTCAVLLPSLRDALSLLHRLAPDASSLLSSFSHLELRAPDKQNRPSLYLTRRSKTSPLADVCSKLIRFFDESFLTAIDTIPLPTQRYPIVPGVYGEIPMGAFMQVNFDVNAALVGEVVKGALNRKLRSCADLYCGCGNFLLPLLHAGFTGVGVETNAPSIAAARNAAAAQNLGGDWICADVPAWANARIESQSVPLDLLVLDPPRAGLKEGVQWITALAPLHLAICSCNPESLGRDLERLLDAGFILESVQLFDMFEHTEHVELLIWLKASATVLKQNQLP